MAKRESILNIKINKEWKGFIKYKDVKSEMKYLDKTLNHFSPEPQNVFKFMKQDPTEIKYILYGQDPYPKKEKGPMIATGTPFEPRGIKSWTDNTHNMSLLHILKALYLLENPTESSNIEHIIDEINNQNFQILNPHDLFTYWQKQGILMLNYALTVGPNAGDQLEYWEKFQTLFLEYIQKLNPEIKFILWGDKVQDLTENKIYLPTITDKHPRRHEFYKENHTFHEITDIDWTGKKILTKKTSL